MASDKFESRAVPGDTPKRLLALLNNYGVSERLQRLLALQLAGGCTRTENGQDVRGEINLQLIIDPIVDQARLLELLSALVPRSTTINGTAASYGGLFANASGRSLERGVSSTTNTTGISSIRRAISRSGHCGHSVVCSMPAHTP